MDTTDEATRLMNTLTEAERRKVRAALAGLPGGAPVPVDEMRDLVDRIRGRITFEEYLGRARHVRGRARPPELGTPRQSVAGGGPGPRR